MFEGVVEVMWICVVYGVVVVLQGGLIGLVGGVYFIVGVVMLLLEWLVGIEEIDFVVVIMIVCVGMLLEVIQCVVDDVGFFVVLDLGVWGLCQIGGNLGMNVGGNWVICYGMVCEMVLGLEYVLFDGMLVISLNKMIKNNVGYDLKQFFIGLEGMLGVIICVVLCM